MSRRASASVRSKGTGRSPFCRFPFALELSAIAHRTDRLAGGATLGLALLLLPSCATQNQDAKEAPAWPERPAPAYPTPPTSEGPVEAPTDGGGPTSQGPAPSSTLAKQYDGKKALSTLEGKATYYADSLAGNHTASGEPYDPELFTAAHRKLPFGAIVRVIRTDTGRITYVKINDRGPFGSRDRIIDLSKAAARDLDMLKSGVVTVRVEVVEKPR